MILLPISQQDNGSIQIYPPDILKKGQGFFERGHNMSVLYPEKGNDSGRLLNVPFCLNIMMSGKYSASTDVLFKSFSDKEQFLIRNVKNDRSGVLERENTELHQHDYFELMYVFKGEVEQQIEKGSYRYSEGQACLLNRNTRHSEELGQNYILIFLCLSKEYLCELMPHLLPKNGLLYKFFANNLEDKAQHLKDYLDFAPLDMQSGICVQMNELFDQIGRELSLMQPGYREMVRGLLIRLLHSLMNPAQYQREHITLDSTKEAYLFQKVTKFMEQKNGRTSRNDLEEALNYSSDYINRIIKKRTGMNISKYAQLLCIKKSEEMLCRTNISVTAIIDTLGFENKTHFYKLFFEKNGMTPLEFRNRMHIH